MEVDFGVEVSGPFTAEGEVAFTHTPAGQVATTVHIGPADQIGAANAALEAWCLANGRQIAGVSWEIYGDPTDDATSFEVRVLYLLG